MLKDVVVNLFKLLAAYLNLDGAFKNEFSGTRERDVAKSIVALFKSNLKFVSAPRTYGNRCTGILRSREDERACHYPGAACERFVFNPAFVSADSDFFGSTSLDKVYVCAIWREHFVMANC